MKKVGIVGAFDILHIGHLNILERAKRLGDELIVFLHTDKVIQKYKNHLPLIPFKDRKRMLENLRCVDEVIPSSSRKGIEIFVNEGITIWAVGSDWHSHKGNLKREEQAKRKGIELVILPYTQGISSTLLARRFKGTT